MAILRCTYCHRRTSDATGKCENCGREIDETFKWIAGPRSSSLHDPVEMDADDGDWNVAEPGKIANAVLRAVAWVEIGASVFGSFWISTNVPNWVGFTIAGGVFLQGIVGSALLFVFAAAGDNLIAIRRELVAPSRHALAEAD